MRKVQFVNTDELWYCFSAEGARPIAYSGANLGELGYCVAHKKKNSMCIQSC